MPPGHAGREKSLRNRKCVALIDVAVVAGVSLLYVVLEIALVAKRWSYAVIGVALLSYVVYLIRQRPHSWRELGFRRDNLSEGLVPVCVFTAVAGAGMVLWSLTQGTGSWGRAALVLFALYPVFAVVQQLAFQGLLHRGLMVLLPSPALQVLVTAGAFAMVHGGSLTLLALTFVAGLAWSLLYRRCRNLWLLAASHSVLAALAYPAVLADDPLSRL